MNRILICDSLYELDVAYRRGALAARAGIPYHANPSRPGTQPFQQWNDGHVHETEGLHALLPSDPVTADVRRNLTYVAA